MTGILATTERLVHVKQSCGNMLSPLSNRLNVYFQVERHKNFVLPHEMWLQVKT